jgi:hypothetical protein
LKWQILWISTGPKEASVDVKGIEAGSKLTRAIELDQADPLADYINHAPGRFSILFCSRGRKWRNIHLPRRKLRLKPFKKPNEASCQPFADTAVTVYHDNATDQRDGLAMIVGAQTDDLRVLRSAGIGTAGRESCLSFGSTLFVDGSETTLEAGERNDNREQASGHWLAQWS